LAGAKRAHPRERLTRRIDCERIVLADKMNCYEYAEVYDKNFKSASGETLQMFCVLQ
jgi:hypothetical protein